MAILADGHVIPIAAKAYRRKFGCQCGIKTAEPTELERNDTRMTNNL
jgi:hypothetical protein